MTHASTTARTIPFWVLLLPFLLTSCLQPAPTSGKLGQRIDHKGYIMTVTQIAIANDFPDARAAKAGNKLVAVELLVESNVRSGVHVSPSHIRLVDGSNRDYKPRTTGKAPILKEQFDIAKGTSVRGWLTFEVPQGVRKMTLINELPQDFKYVEIKVDLSE